MSELTNANKNRTNFRWQLLATVSAIALLACAYEGSGARAADDDSDRPPVWIELGGQLSRLNEGQEAFSPPLMADRPSIFSPSQKFEKLPLYSLDETGKISFEPGSSGWVFSASVRYGRSGSDRHVRQQTNPEPFKKYYTKSGVPKTSIVTPSAAKFADTKTRNEEHHAILDFQAGKDVGLGMFGGKSGSSVFSLGVRFAQFNSKSNIALQSDPDWHFFYYDYGTKKLNLGDIYHSRGAGIVAARSFHGIGPSLSWNASAPVMGNKQSSELTFDWGVNVAVLFGRQRANVHHHAIEQYHGAKYATGAKYPEGARVTVYDPPPVDRDRAKTVTVPNVGGFAGLSLRIENATVSAGYRADFFFGAMDGGIDAAKKENVGFYGPFAAISVGLGG